MINKTNVNLCNWIHTNTVNSAAVLELGAGFFHKLSFVHSSVKRKAGIEIWKPYLDNSTYHDCEKILGDVLDYEKLINVEDFDTVLLVDILEHFEKTVALNLIKKLILQFNRVLLMIPEGNHPQTSDVTGFGAHEYQTHKSTWTANDFYELAPTEILLDSNFHAGDPIKDSGCLFVKWIK